MNLIVDVTRGLGRTDLSGLEQLQALMASGKRPGISDSLDFTLAEAEVGRAVFEGVPGHHAYNPIGMVHGGYAATLLDSACGCAVHSQLKAGQAYTTLEIKVAYLKALTDTVGIWVSVVETLPRAAATARAALMRPAP